MKKIFARVFNREDFTKNIRIMKLTILIFLIVGIQSFASSYAQLQKFSFSMNDASIEDVIEFIENESDFYFFLKQDASILKKRIDVNYEDATVDDILTELLKETSLTYKVVDKYIAIVPQDPSSQQKSTVSGQVVDQSGKPLPGVTVLEKGTTNGTITDFDGNFQINLEDQDAVLVFSFIGMKDTERVATFSEPVKIVMQDELIGLDEVVVTALGIKREEKALGYAVQKVKGDALSKVKGVDVSTSLTGRVAGLLVKNTTEFAKESAIQIRGEEPLLVIDGVPYGNMSLRDVPSDDIEGINVLKGATASALYGSRGESGAIIITTKKGSKDKGLSVSVNSSSMFHSGFLAIPEMQSTYGRKVITATNTYTGQGQGSWGPPLEGQEVIQWDPISKTYKPMPFLPRGKDNFKNFLEQGHILNNNVSIVQQGEHGSLRSSATWVQNKGQYPNSMFNKFTYSLGGDITLDKFTLSSSITYNKQKSPNIGFNGFTSYDPMFTMLVWSSPDWDVRKYKDYWLVENESQNNSYTAKCNNPYFDRYERTHSLDKDVFNGSISLDYEIQPWLNATLRSGFDTYSNHQEITLSKGNYVSTGSATVLDEGGSQIWGESQKGSYNIGLGRGYSLNTDFLLSGQQKFGDWGIDGFIGASMFYKHYEGIEAKTSKGLSIPGYYSLKASVEPAKVKSLLRRKQVNSLYGQLAFSWKNTVFVDGTLRNDWSSTLPESTRSYLYPSVSGSFIVSEILPSMTWLSFWKLRGSWATSKRAAGIYETNEVFNITTEAWDGLTSAAYPTTIRGSDVTAESSESFEVGTNVNVLNNRASLDVAYYQKKMTDEILNATVSSASGFNNKLINSDQETTRKGLEVALSVTPIREKDLKWDLMFNWSKYARYYTKLDPEFSSDNPWVKVGERADHLIGKEFLRDGEGNIIHNDSGLPVQSSYRSSLGYRDPDWIWGANSTLTYKNFTFGLAVDGRVGGMTESYTESYMWRTGNHPDSTVPERYLDATNPGTSNYVGEGVKVVSGDVTYDTYGNIVTDTRVFAPNDTPVTYERYVGKLYNNIAWWVPPTPNDVKETTFFKIREVSLTYQLPKEFCSKFGAEEALVSAIGQNLFLWAKDFKYSDPDEGSENFSDPSVRYLGLNVKLSF